MNENNFQKLTSKAKYKDIDTIKFTPVQEIKITKVVEKGQRKFWKWLGIIPIIPYKAKCDRYRINENDSWVLACKSSTIDEIKQKIFDDNRRYFFDKDNKLFKEAQVEIKYYNNSNRSYEEKYFRTNHEAMVYFNSIKSNCEEVGNELK